MLTDKLFTGQRLVADLGIYHYGARFYSPKIGRFLSADTIVPGYANPQNLNRYSYVRNNPLRYTDPTGHLLDPGESGGGSSCNIFNSNCTPTGSGGGGGGGGCNTLASCGGGDSGGGGLSDTDSDPCAATQWGEWGCVYSSLLEESSHYYEVSNVVCPASWHCTQKEMIYYLSLFAYPGQDPLDGPAVPGVNYSVSPPFGWFPDAWPLSNIRNMGSIQVVPSNGGLTSTNVTQPSHIFCCGKVERSLRQDASGAWTVTSVGTGSNSNAFTGALNNTVGPGLFEEMDTLMLIYIMEQKFPEPFPVPQD